ncbi:MAG: glycoside hydrolase family 3 C-terminal domain-containing protein [Nitriliruptoraceae bacterium]
MTDHTPASEPTDAPIPSDAERIVADLDLPTKVRLLSGADTWHLEGVAGAGLAPIMVTDGPHGLRKQAEGGDQLGLAGAVPATCFPTAVTLGSSWDVDLATEVGVALGREARAEQVAVLLGPGLNLKRHPAGGRNFEYLSEDPVVAGHLAAALVRGIQSQGVGACLKHLAANHQETFRMVVDTIVDERTLRELELTAFELAVRGGRPWTVMSAYNRLNGTYCSDHHWLLTEVLREEWGFDGLVMTDWSGMNDRVAATNAGCDLEMPGSGKAFDAEVLDAVQAGRLDEAAVDRCAVRVVELLIRAGAHHDPRATYDPDAHHALARRAAAAGTVLLTNDGTLPLQAADGTGPARLALVGAFAARPRFQGAGSSQVTTTRLDDLRQALPAQLPDTEVAYAAGYDPSTGTTTDQLVADAVAAAGAAEVAVVVVGLPGSYESEGFDREHLALPAGHTRVVEAVLATGTPTVVVLQNGAPVVLPWADRAAAVVEAYLGGQAGGGALADVLTGRLEPGGRLAESFPAAVADLPAHADFAAHPKQVVHREGPLVGYRFHDTAGVAAAFPFGHGLGYTTFTLDEVEVTGGGVEREVHATVRNTGPRAGSEVVQVYLAKRDSAVWRPAQELAAFAKVHLDAGEERRLRLGLDRLAFRVYDTTTGAWVVEPGAYEVRVGRSSVELAAAVTIEVASDDQLTPGVIPAGTVPTPSEFEALLGRPVPEPDPVQPFTRNTPVADLVATPLGAQVRKALLAVGRRQVDKAVPADDEAMRRMFESVLEEAPLRAISLLAGGRPPLRWIDAMLDVLNGRVRGKLSELLGQLRP